MAIDRRGFVVGAAALAAGGLAARARAGMGGRLIEPPDPDATEPDHDCPPARADSIIYIYLPGGMAQTDMWDPKGFTPYKKGMKGSELLGTCESIPTCSAGWWSR